MGYSRRMKITPLPVKQFIAKYHEGKEKGLNVAEEYWKYLRANQLGHHYNGLKNRVEWYKEEMEVYTGTPYSHLLIPLAITIVVMAYHFKDML